MPYNTLEQKLNWLDFETDSSASGLLFTDRDYKEDGNVSFDEILILQQAKELNASAVYFRRMGEESIPQLFIYDNSDNILDKDLSHIHIKLWSSGIVPLYYVFDKTEVRIFNCRKPVNKKTLKAKELDKLSFEREGLFLVSEVHKEYKKYSASLFQNGSFWESNENKSEFRLNNSSYKKLIEMLKKIRDEFVRGQNEHICNKLLVLSIFIKYLEEREDCKGNRVLDTDYFNKYDGARSFCDILRKDKCIQFFKDLGKDINGKIFKLDKDEENEVAKLDQSKLADFLDAKQDKYQYVFWRLYDFNYLPIELISRIYEEFIPHRKDITYTPAHLVNFMVDKCMPIGKPREDISIIDVSCGSGIFLVAAFKRIVQWWQKEEYERTGQIKRPTIRKLKSILSKQIFGVDLEPEAVELAIFSLTVGLCDMLEPKKAWDQLTEEKLIDLSENIVAQDFFDFVETKEKFDLIIGNPPFNPPVEKKEEYWDNITNKLELDYEIPYKNIALLFLQQSMKLLKKEGLLSLVIPSGPLLYNKTMRHRRQFLNRYNVPQIFDFSSLSGVLFEGRNYPVVVLFVQNIPPDDKDILHVAVRRTRTSKEKLHLEIDKYDLYYVPKELAKTDELIWKANLLGSGHLYHLLKRLQNVKTLEKYLKEKKKKDGWFFAEGYKPKGESTKKPKTAPWLTNKDWIPTEKFVDDKIDKDDILRESACFFDRTRKENKLIFDAPHVLIRETPSLPIAFCDYELVFRREIVGIYAPKAQDLLEMRNNIIRNKRLYKMLLLSMSGRAGVSRSTGTIYKRDIMALPYPDDFNKLRLSKAEEIVCNDVIEYYAEQLAKNEEAKVNIENANEQILRAFAKVFCDSLNSIYKEGTKLFYPLEPIESLSFICFAFGYGNPNKPKTMSKSEKRQIENGDLRCLMEDEQDANILYKRVIKRYRERDMVYLVKPKTLRYWLKSIALRDANEVFRDLVSSGY
ncbi:MAG TPA: N-6 DNA methylase [Sedimentisphaerales bacterium]|nr:N-6 DNA methylase [Sedimentisphaerales bacterium]